MASIKNLKNSDVDWNTVMIKAAKDREDQVFVMAAKLNEENWRNVCEDLMHDSLLDGDEEDIRFIYKYFRLSEPDINNRAELLESMIPLGKLDIIIHVCTLDTDMLPPMLSSCCKFNSIKLWNKIKQNKFDLTIDNIKQFILQSTVHNREHLLEEAINLYESLVDKLEVNENTDADDVNIYEMLFMLMIERDIEMQNIISLVLPRIEELSNYNGIIKEAAKLAEVMGHVEKLKFCICNQ